MQHTRCRGCGNTFYYAREEGARKYCHHPCQSVKHHGQSYKRPLTIRQCRKCGVDFPVIQYHGGQRFCEKHNPNSRKAIKHTTCKTCGVTFAYPHGGGTPRYCQNPCLSPTAKRWLSITHKPGSKRTESKPKYFIEADESLKELQAWMAEERKHL